MIDSWTKFLFLLLFFHPLKGNYNANHKSQYVSIKDFNKFVTNKTKYHGKNILLDIGYNFFSSSRILECHVEYFISINHTKSVLLTEENEHVNFQNFKRLTIAPFIIYTIYNNTTSCNNTTTCYE